jgi:hypothetical protein
MSQYAREAQVTSLLADNRRWETKSNPEQTGVARQPWRRQLIWGWCADEYTLQVRRQRGGNSPSNYPWVALVMRPGGDSNYWQSSREFLDERCLLSYNINHSIYVSYFPARLILIITWNNEEWFHVIRSLYTLAPITVTARSEAWTAFARWNPRSWVRIPLKAWISVRVYFVFVLFCV